MYGLLLLSSSSELFSYLFKTPLLTTIYFISSSSKENLEGFLVKKGQIVKDMRITFKGIFMNVQ